MNERTLGIHQIELVVNAGHDLRDRRAVRDHAARTHHLRQVTTRDNRGRLVVDSAFEASRAPVDELDRALRLDRRNLCCERYSSPGLKIHFGYLPHVGLVSRERVTTVVDFHLMCITGRPSFITSKPAFSPKL